MVKVSIGDIVGTVILLILFVALQPLMETSLGILLPQLGPTESLIARSIPLVILLVIFLNPLDDGPVQVRR